MILVLFMNGYWKIADFGLTSEATSNRLVSTSAARGKPCYRAPEMLRETSPGFNNKMDMWSFGCIAYELLTGRKAFSSDYEVFSYSISKKKPKTYFKHIDSITKFYISDLFELEPDNRPAARELLKLKFTGKTPLTNPTQSTSNRSQKRRRLEKQIIPQSELLTATLEWADINGKIELIFTLLGCGVNPIHNMVTDGMSLLMQAISFGSLEVVELVQENRLRIHLSRIASSRSQGSCAFDSRAEPVGSGQAVGRVRSRRLRKGHRSMDDVTLGGVARAQGRGRAAVGQDGGRRRRREGRRWIDGVTLGGRGGHKDVVALLLDKMEGADDRREG